MSHCLFIASAQNNLATCYYNGTGVDEDEEEAVEWYRKAAEQGLVSAQKRLAKCYEDGIGVERNGTEALKWLNMDGKPTKTPYSPVEMSFEEFAYDIE